MVMPLLKIFKILVNCCMRFNLASHWSCTSSLVPAYAKHIHTKKCASPAVMHANTRQRRFAPKEVKGASEEGEPMDLHHNIALCSSHKSGTISDPGCSFVLRRADRRSRRERRVRLQLQAEQWCHQACCSGTRVQRLCLRWSRQECRPYE